MNAELSPMVRFQLAAARSVTRTLRLLGLREAAFSLRTEAHRARRGMFERRGSARYSRPALHHMDVKLDQIIGRDGGFFVEAGGFDGFTQSNTYYLERFRGWRGILIEPMPELAAIARRNRPEADVMQCALVGSDHEGDSISMESGDLMSNVSGTNDRDWARAGLVLGWRDHRIEEVPARTLSDVLRDAGDPEVDLLSLDVEGYEPVVLTGLDLDRHAPAWVLVEMHDLDAGRAKVAPLLGERYVEHDQLSPLDVLYRRRDLDPHRGASEVT